MAQHGDKTQFPEHLRLRLKQLETDNVHDNLVRDAHEMQDVNASLQRCKKL